MPKYVLSIWIFCIYITFMHYYIHSTKFGGWSVLDMTLLMSSFFDILLMLFFFFFACRCSHQRTLTLSATRIRILKLSMIIKYLDLVRTSSGIKTLSCSLSTWAPSLMRRCLGLVILDDPQNHFIIIAHLSFSFVHCSSWETDLSVNIFLFFLSAELKKKSTKSKRPSIKSLFGSHYPLFICMLSF